MLCLFPDVPTSQQADMRYRQHITGFVVNTGLALYSKKGYYSYNKHVSKISKILATV